MHCCDCRGGQRAQRLRAGADAPYPRCVRYQPVAVCLRDVVVPGAVILTDGWGGYNGLTDYEYTHKKTVLSSSDNPAHVSMPGVHRVASLLKRWILGTHQGSIVPAHLQSYLEEFTFRFNRRTSRSRGLLFRRLLEQAVATRPVTEADITHGYNWPRFRQFGTRRS